MDCLLFFLFERASAFLEDTRSKWDENQWEKLSRVRGSCIGLRSGKLSTFLNIPAPHHWIYLYVLESIPSQTLFVSLLLTSITGIDENSGNKEKKTQSKLYKSLNLKFYWILAVTNCLFSLDEIKIKNKTKIL